jgi:hypothetical protein
MQDFSLYFELGWEHICDWQGYDHILFVAVLCASYVASQWRKVLVLVTAFTIGHSLTLALSALHIVSINTSLIEFLIPVTIVITSMLNIASKSRTTGRNSAVSARKKAANGRAVATYLLAMFFGLIHGLGFSNYLKSLLGKTESIVPQLLAFNLGLEFGQLLIVGITLFLSFLVVQVFRSSRRDWVFFLSSAIFGIALVMSIERFNLIRL